MREKDFLFLGAAAGRDKAWLVEYGSGVGR